MQQKTGHWKEVNLKSFHLPFTRTVKDRAVKHREDSSVKFHCQQTQDRAATEEDRVFSKERRHTGVFESSHFQETLEEN